jgi:hypothetical protein
MKQFIQIFVLMLVVAVITASCAPKHHCKGLKAHPGYKSSWAKK